MNTGTSTTKKTWDKKKEMFFQTPIEGNQVGKYPIDSKAYPSSEAYLDLCIV